MEGIKDLVHAKMGRAKKGNALRVMLSARKEPGWRDSKGGKKKKGGKTAGPSRLPTYLIRTFLKKRESIIYFFALAVREKNQGTSEKKKKRKRREVALSIRQHDRSRGERGKRKSGRHY